MTTVALPQVRRRVARVAPETIAEGRRARREHLVLFLGVWAAYSAIGYRYVVEHHVYTVDAVSRYAHAFFIWHNDPPKLAAVGFIWAPISTLIFLPAAALRSLSTTLIGMPITTGAFGAGLAVVLYRTLRSLEMPRLQALALVLAFAGNPLIVYYSVNGMSEIPYLFFLTFGIYEFVMWFLRREPRYLIVCGIMLSLGFLTRYEVLMWAVLLVPILTVAMIRQRVSRDYLEGALIAYLAPIAYGLGLWIFLNWLIQGNAFYWLTPQTQAVPVGLQKRIDSTAAGWGPVEVVHQVVDVYWRIFPPTLIVFGALAVLFVLRRGRDMMLPTLGLILGVNAAFIAALVYKSQQAPNLQLRYNMRDMPLTLVAMGWIYLTAGSRWRRHAVWLACFAALLLAYPVTWQTMKTYPYQFLEQAFTRSVTQDRSQEGTLSIGWVFGKGDNFTVGIDDSLRMAAWVKRHNLPRNSVLTDDAQTFWTMLLSGRPDIFVDRIDQGDAHWLDLLDNPWGRVRYFLTTQNGDDKIGYRYPGIYRIPWAHLVHNEHKLALFRIDKRDHA